MKASRAALLLLLLAGLSAALAGVADDMLEFEDVDEEDKFDYEKKKLTPEERAAAYEKTRAETFVWLHERGQQVGMFLAAALGLGLANTWLQTQRKWSSESAQRAAEAALRTACMKGGSAPPGGFAATDLHEAAARGDLAAVRQLLASATDPNAENVRNAFGDSPLHVAVSGGHADVVSALLEGGADPSCATHAGFTPLMRAACVGCDIIELATRDRKAPTAKYVTVAKLLLANGADGEAKNRHGLKAADYASEAGVSGWPQ